MKTYVILFFASLGLAGISMVFASQIITDPKMGHDFLLAGCDVAVISACGILFLFGESRVLADRSFVSWLLCFLLMGMFCLLAYAAGSEITFFKDLPAILLCLLGPVSFFTGYVSWWIKIGKKVGYKFGDFLLV